jgi:hypothetical protein
MQVLSYALTNETTSTPNIVEFDDGEIHASTSDDTKDINMLFMMNETVIFRDGKGINQEVTYFGPCLADGIWKHKIWTCKDAELLVDAVLFSSLDDPDIVAIPSTPEQYVANLHKLTESELQQISTLQSLDSNQRELMELHYKLNHLPLLAMIMLAEKGKIKKKFAKLKHRLPICMSCIFGMAHHKPWRFKGSKGSI